MRVEDFGPKYLYHMTHIDNLPSILRRGLMAHGNNFQKEDISNQEVNARRSRKEPIFGKRIHEYVPFYFNPKNAMMYRNRHNDIVVLAYSTKLLYQEGVIFTDRNASTNSVRFYQHLYNLKRLDWKEIFSTNWYHSTETKQKMMAEVLVPFTINMDFLEYVYCKNSRQETEVFDMGLPWDMIEIRPELFFIQQKRKNRYCA